MRDSAPGFARPSAAVCLVILSSAVITLAASLALAVFRIVPAGDLAMAFVLALPSCLYALRHRSMEAARVQAGRVIVCLIAGYALIPFAALFHDVYRWMRRPWSMDEFVVLGGALYYLLRAAYEACAAQSMPRRPTSGAAKP